MKERNMKLKDIYNDTFSLDNVLEKDRYPMHDWNFELLNKTFEQINLFDVTRMIIQKIYVEVAVVKRSSMVSKTQ